jgi:hypothetical protein
LSSQEFGSFFGRGNHQAVRTQSNCPCLLLRQRWVRRVWSQNRFSKELY